MITRTPLPSLSVLLLVLSSTFSLAEQHTIEMKNRGGEDGNMVFEPGYLKAQPGDTIKFLATGPTHNSVSDTVP